MSTADAFIGTDMQFDVAALKGVSPNITLFGCENGNLNTAPLYTGTSREYAEGFQTLPVNWSPVSSNTKAAIFNDLGDRTGGSTGGVGPENVVVNDLDIALDDGDSTNPLTSNDGNETFSLVPGHTYVVAVNTGINKNRNGDVDLAADPPAATVGWNTGSSVVTTGMSSIYNQVWYGSGSTTERQRLQVYEYNATTSSPTADVFVDVAYGSSVHGISLMVVAEVESSTLDQVGTYNGGQDFTTPNYTTTEIDYTADGTTREGALSVVVFRDDDQVMTPETGWVTSPDVLVETGPFGSGPEASLNVDWDDASDPEASHFLSASVRYAGLLAEIDVT